MSEDCKVFFSVIVPVYNCEHYVEKCISSIVCQSFDDYEILIIDDGSTDSSLDKVRVLERKYRNVKVFSQKNGGVSSARNCGINNARGEYIIFIDSDDWVDTEYFSMAYEILRLGFDGVIFNYFTVEGSAKNKVRLIEGCKHLSDDNLESLLLLSKITNGPCDKIFKRELYKTNHILFPEGISVGEDALVTYNLLKQSNSIVLSSEAYLNYRYHIDSVTKSQVTKKKLEDILYVARAISYKESHSSQSHAFTIRLIIDYYISALKNSELVDVVIEIENQVVESLERSKLSNFVSWKVKLKIALLKVLSNMRMLHFLKYFR
jgi:glycosyltransferase involved in cell wall biosynthesis